MDSPRRPEPQPSTSSAHARYRTGAATGSSGSLVPADRGGFGGTVGRTALRALVDNFENERELAARQSHRSQARIKLLALASDLDDRGIRSILSGADELDQYLRCWDPSHGHRRVRVHCGQDAGDRWEFRDQSGEHLADAEDVVERGDAAEFAERYAAELRNLDRHVEPKPIPELGAGKADVPAIEAGKSQAVS